MGDSYWLYKNLTATGVSTITISQFGLLHGVVVNQLSTAAATMAIYNATTTANAPNIVATPQLNAVSNTDYVYDCEMSNGITVSIGAAATPIDITIIYR